MWEVCSYSMKIPEIFLVKALEQIFYDDMHDMRNESKTIINQSLICGQNVWFIWSTWDLFEKNKLYETIS